MGYYDSSFMTVFEYERGHNIAQKLFIVGERQDNEEKFVVVDVDLEDEKEIPEMIKMTEKHASQLIEDWNADGLKLYIKDDVIPMYKDDLDASLSKLLDNISEQTIKAEGYQAKKQELDM
ncbi:hypothetical protein [Brochothrix campestris]|uniref:Uncharacterized protein n=1 Tax=Brochothrix campestris FSL F6-1037 TaxID=1265861 RepID=W7CB07_9LIST|nr:hypothetical protein [Brochothrix campestris]EUJ34107.1 hypothetical protein BCAMP_12788 [Brochothrix campestris FSL F6-1037]